MARIDQPLRVLIDGRKLGHGGIGEYIRNLIEGLLAFNQSVGTTCVKVGVIALPEVAERFAWSSQVEVLEDRTRLYSLAEYFRLGRRLPCSAYDIYHSPHYTLPYGISIPTVVTIHDLIHLEHPERWYYPFVAGRLIRSAASRATRILAVSRTTSQALRRFFREDAALLQKLRVVPNALSRSLVLHSPRPSWTLDRFGIKERFLFSVISMNKPHKGLKELVRAFARVRIVDPQLSLVVAGQGVRPGALDGLTFLGPISESDLFDLYGACAALVVPSRVEGFCIPAMQAKALGTVVVGRPLDPLRELLDSNDVICEDMTVDALAEGMQRAATRSHPTHRDVEHFRARFNLNAIAGAVIGQYLEIAPRSLPWLGALLQQAQRRYAHVQEAA